MAKDYQRHPNWFFKPSEQLIRLRHISWGSKHRRQEKIRAS